jgi:hypothetical protein
VEKKKWKKKSEKKVWLWVELKNSGKKIVEKVKKVKKGAG